MAGILDSPRGTNSHYVAVEGEEGVPPEIMAEEGIVAATQDASGRKESFDGRQACVGVGVDLGTARVGCPPSARDGAHFDGFDRFAHSRGMAPVGVEQEERAVGVSHGERRGVGREQEVARKVGLLPKGIAQKIQSRRSAKRLNRALTAVFAAPDDDEDRRGLHLTPTRAASPLRRHG